MWLLGGWAYYIGKVKGTGILIRMGKFKHLGKTLQLHIKKGGELWFPESTDFSFS